MWNVCQQALLWKSNRSSVAFWSWNQSILGGCEAKKKNVLQPLPSLHHAPVGFHFTFCSPLFTFVQHCWNSAGNRNHWAYLNLLLSIVSPHMMLAKEMHSCAHRKDTAVVTIVTFIYISRHIFHTAVALLKLTNISANLQPLFNHFPPLINSFLIPST